MPYKQCDWDASRKLSYEINQYREVLPLLKRLHSKVCICMYVLLCMYIMSVCVCILSYVHVHVCDDFCCNIFIF